MYSQYCLYLLCTASNVLVCSVQRRVKLCDFSQTVDYTACDTDAEEIGDVMECLDPHITPPEVFFCKFGFPNV